MLALSFKAFRAEAMHSAYLGRITSARLRKNRVFTLSCREALLCSVPLGTFPRSWEGRLWQDDAFAVSSALGNIIMMKGYRQL